MRSPFEINVSSIAAKTGYRMDADSVGPLEDLKTSGSHVAPEVPVSFHGQIECIEGGLMAEGDVATNWVGECRRCLTPADGTIDVHVRELFEKNATEGDSYPIDGDYVNLEALVRESVMLELPVAPLCQLDCAGLCPECGANRNETDCGHNSKPKDDRWSALDELKLN